MVAEVDENTSLYDEGHVPGALLAPPGYESEGAARGGHIPGAQSVP